MRPSPLLQNQRLLAFWPPHLHLLTIASNLVRRHVHLSAGFIDPSLTGIGFGQHRCLHEHESIDNQPHPPHFLPSVAASSFLPPVFRPSTSSNRFGEFFLWLIDVLLFR
jgi:hypothetical protein